MVAEPTETPVTELEDKPVDVTVAILVALLLHVPGKVASLNAVVDPASQTDAVPVIGAGIGNTVTLVVAIHPVLVMV